MGTAKATESVERQLEKAQKKIAALEKTNVELRKALTDEQEHHKSFLEVFLDGQYKEIAEEKENTAAKIRAAATPENLLSSEDRAAILDREACVWRQASRVLRKGAAAEFPAAQAILAAIDGTDKPPLRSHLLLIAALVELIAEARGRITNLRGLQAEINSDIREKHQNVLGLGETKIQQMLADANKAGGNEGFNVSQ